MTAMIEMGMQMIMVKIIFLAVDECHWWKPKGCWFQDEDGNDNDDDVAKKPAKLCDQKETLEEKWPDLPQREDQSIREEAQKPDT